MSEHPAVNDCNSKGMVPSRTRRNGRSTQYIDHSADIASSISGLYGNDQFSDVTLVVQGVQFKAHRIILAARSEYFRALLYGGLAESSRSIIHLNDINAVAFKQVLLYIYTGRLNVQQLRTMLDVLGLAHQYDFQRLESALSTHLTRSLRLSNIWFIYNLAVLYNLEELINACLTFLDGIAPAPLYSPHFLRLSQPAVERLLSRDSFCASEIEIFRSLCAWFRANEEVDSPPGVDQTVSKDCVELFRGNLAPSVLPDTIASVPPFTTDYQLLPVESGDTHTEQKEHKGGEPPSNSESATSKCVSPDSHVRNTSENEAARRVELPRCQMIRHCVRFELMSLCDLLTEVRSSKLVSPDDLLDAISRQAKASNELPHRGWLLPGINLASPRFAASLVAGEEGSYPYFFVDDADDNQGDFTKLQFALSALRSSVAPTSDADLVRLMDDELDEEEEVEESEEDAEELEGEPQLPSSSRSEPTGTVPFTNSGMGRTVPSGSYSSVQLPGVAAPTAGALVADDAGTDQFDFGAGNHNFNTTYSAEPQFPHTRVLSSGLGPSGLHTSSGRAQARTIPMNETHQPSVDPYLRRISQRSRMSTIATGSTSTADTGVTPTVGTAWQSGSMHLNHQLGPPLYRSMRWLQPSRCARGRIASHPPPPPHSEHDVVRHSLDDPDAHIVIRLGKPSIVNTIRMQLWDREIRCYSYYVEVSLDQTSWYRVVDYRNYLCRSWQTLHFPARVVHYIRITGTRNTANRTFHLITFRCLYTDHVCRQLDGFLVPNYNVASVEHGATVLEGVSRNRNALIDGNARMYDWNSGYTCHQLGNGAIVVQLSQPFLLRSMRFLLWDLDDRTYSYSVHVSTNREEWRLIHDATRERCQSWQVITFPLQLVTFIRVIGTHNTANEVFHMVHLECAYPPAEILEDQAASSKANSTLAVNLANLSLRHEDMAPNGTDSTSVSGRSEPNSMSEHASYQATQATELHDSGSNLDPVELDTRPHSPPSPSEHRPHDDADDPIPLSANSTARSLLHLPATQETYSGPANDFGSQSAEPHVDAESSSSSHVSLTRLAPCTESPLFVRHMSAGSTGMNRSLRTYPSGHVSVSMDTASLPSSSTAPSAIIRDNVRLPSYSRS